MSDYFSAGCPCCPGQVGLNPEGICWPAQFKVLISPWACLPDVFLLGAEASQRRRAKY